MKHFIAIAISVCALCSCALAQSLRSQLNATQKQVCKLMMAKDAAGFKAYLKTAVTDDFQYVENGQKETFDQMCDGVTQGFSQMGTIKIAKTKILSLHQKGNSATATVMHMMRA